MNIGDYVYAIDEYNNYIEGIITDFIQYNRPQVVITLKSGKQKRISEKNVFESAEQRTAFLKQHMNIVEYIRA